MADIRSDLEQLLRDHQWDREAGEPCMPYKAAWLALQALDAGTVQGPVCAHPPTSRCFHCITDVAAVEAMAGVKIPPGALPPRSADATPRGHTP